MILVFDVALLEYPDYIFTECYLHYVGEFYVEKSKLKKMSWGSVFKKYNLKFKFK